MRRLLCVLSTPLESGKVKHYRLRVGVALDEKQELPPPRLLVIETDTDKPEAGALLYCSSSNGECVGDTWHESIDVAKEYASDEYGRAGLIWQEIPADITIDALAMAEFGAAVHDDR